MILHFQTNRYNITLFESGIRIQTLNGKFDQWVHKKQSYIALEELKDTITLTFDKWTILCNYMKTIKPKQI